VMEIENGTVDRVVVGMESTALSLSGANVSVVSVDVAPSLPSLVLPPVS
jgi:hypothetical protein